MRIGAVLTVMLLVGSGVASLEPVRPALAAVPPFRTLADLADLAGPGAIGDETAAAVGSAEPEPGAPVPSGVPEVVLVAYQRAETAMRGTAPECGLTWWMVAAIGKMESDHAEGGQVDASGTTRNAIFGPWLDGSNGTAAIPAAGGAAGRTAWERAVGPMQFLPTTWAVYGDGGDPHDVGDAALAAGRLLCAGGTDLAVPGRLAEALFRYNPSADYVDAVLAWARTYADGPVVALPPVTGADPVPTAPARGSVASAAAAAAAVDFATAQLGLPYVWGGDGPGNGDAGFDCSGLTHAAYVAAGIPTPRTAQTQYDAGPRLGAGAPLHPGDLVFYGTPDRVHHVGLYIGNGRMINAPTFGKPVQSAGYRWWGDDFVGATRPAARPGSLPLVPPVRTTRAAVLGSAAPRPAQVPVPAVLLAPVPMIAAAPVADPPIEASFAAVPPSPTSTPTAPPSADPAAATRPPTPPVPPTPPTPPVPHSPQTRPAPDRAPLSAPPKPVATPPVEAAPAVTPAPRPGTPGSLGPALPEMTRARTVALFASARYAAVPTLVFRDAASGEVVVLTRERTDRPPRIGDAG